MQVLETGNRQASSASLNGDSDKMKLKASPFQPDFCVLDVLMLAICTVTVYSNGTSVIKNVPSLSFAKFSTCLPSETSGRQREVIVQTHHHV